MGAAGTASEGRKGPRHALGGSAARDMAKTLLRAWPSPLIWDPQHPPGTPGDPPETLGDHRVRHGGGSLNHWVNLPQYYISSYFNAAYVEPRAKRLFLLRSLDNSCRNSLEQKEGTPRHALGSSAARDMAKTLVGAWPCPLIWGGWNISKECLL